MKNRVLMLAVTCLALGLPVRASDLDLNGVFDGVVGALAAQGQRMLDDVKRYEKEHEKEMSEIRAKLVQDMVASEAEQIAAAEALLKKVREKDLQAVFLLGDVCSAFLEVEKLVKTDVPEKQKILDVFRSSRPFRSVLLKAMPEITKPFDRYDDELRKLPLDALKSTDPDVMARRQVLHIHIWSMANHSQAQWVLAKEALDTAQESVSGGIVRE